MGEHMPSFCSAELDRLTAAEISIDEAMTIFERHGAPVPADLLRLSMGFNNLLHHIEGSVKRYQRLRRVRDVLTVALPLEDEDLTPPSPRLPDKPEAKTSIP